MIPDEYLTNKIEDDKRQQLLNEIKELKSLLRYVYYARLPSGDKVDDHIPYEYAKRVVEFLQRP